MQAIAGTLESEGEKSQKRDTEPQRNGTEGINGSSGAELGFKIKFGYSYFFIIKKSNPYVSFFACFRLKCAKILEIIALYIYIQVCTHIYTKSVPT